MSGMPSDFGYQTGNYIPWAIPPFLAKSVVIRPFGEYGMGLVGFTTTQGGTYGVNYQSSGSIDTTDLEYLYQNELQAIPDLEQVLIAIYWYTPENSNLVLPAIGPDVQNDAWTGTPPPLFSAGGYSISSAYQLTHTHQVWPSQNDATLVNGIQWLLNKGLKVGLIPINAFLSKSLYYTGGGEWQIDRSAQNWNNLTSYLLSYWTFIVSYINLCSSNSLALSLFSIGYGLRDLTGIADRTQIPLILNILKNLASYCKANLPNTKVTYLADLDEYYYPYQVSNQIDGALDAFWTHPYLDFIGINWFAPLAMDNSEDMRSLTFNVLRGEAYDYSVPGFVWRNNLTNRLLSTTNNTFKVGLSQVEMDPRIYGIKNIEDWLTFSHYTPATTAMAGCTPPAGVFNPSRVCSGIQGNAQMVSLQAPLFPSLGGIFKSPPRNNVYANLNLDSNCTFTFPTLIVDSSVLDFEFQYSLEPGQSGNIFNTSFGVSLDYVDDSAILTLGTQVIPLFTAWEGSVGLSYTPTAVTIYVNGAFVSTVTGTFVMPAQGGSMNFGGWIGKLFYIKFILGVGNNFCGGEFYFEDAYAGVRTAWKPGLKPWVALTGYGSMEGTGADPFSRPETILWPGAASVPPVYPNESVLNAAVFRNSYTIKDIQIPYGSPGDIDWRYQAIVLYCAIRGLMPAGPQSISVWFLDTRSLQAMTNTLPEPAMQQIFNDAFDADINASLNGKPVIHQATNQLTVYEPYPTVDNLLGLSDVPGDLPRIRSVLVEPGVPQGSSMNP